MLFVAEKGVVKRIARAIMWIVALFYAYGALVHVMNMLSLTGFDWLNAPRKWQVLDIIYLVFDLIVAIGFLARWKVSYAVFYLAASSQIVLYTAFRDWITNVPEEFALSPEQASYLNILVMFHCVTLILVTIALRVAHNHQTA